MEIYIFTGYFRKVSERMDSDDNRYIEFTIPNREVKYIFRAKVLNWFNEKVKARDRSKLFTALVNQGKSNREGGTGRSDLFVKPVTRRKPAYVLEFKVAEKFIAG